MHIRTYVRRHRVIKSLCIIQPWTLLPWETPERLQGHSRKQTWLTMVISRVTDGWCYVKVAEVWHLLADEQTLPLYDMHFAASIKYNSFTPSPSPAIGEGRDPRECLSSQEATNIVRMGLWVISWQTLGGGGGVCSEWQWISLCLTERVHCRSTWHNLLVALHKLPTPKIENATYDLS